jgi:tetratricopeptide (TPR) repeat protein
LELAGTYRGQAALAYAAGEHETARRLMEQELATLQGLESSFKSAEQQWDNAELQYHLGWVNGNLGYYYRHKAPPDDERAAAYFNQAVASLTAALQANDRSPRFRQGLVVQLQNLGDVYAALGKPAEALQAARALVQVAGDDPHSLYCAACYLARGLDHWRDSAQAQASRRQALDWLRQATERDAKRDPRINLDLDFLHRLQADRPE